MEHKRGPRRKRSRFNLHALRRRTGLPQAKFWGKVGLSQAAGSRAESDNELPPSVDKLVNLQYVVGVDVDTGEKIKPLAGDEK